MLLHNCSLRVKQLFSTSMFPIHPILEPHMTDFDTILSAPSTANDPSPIVAPDPEFIIQHHRDLFTSIGPGSSPMTFHFKTIGDNEAYSNGRYMKAGLVAYGINIPSYFDRRTLLQLRALIDAALTSL